MIFMSVDPLVIVREMYPKQGRQMVTFRGVRIQSILYHLTWEVPHPPLFNGNTSHVESAGVRWSLC